MNNDHQIPRHHHIVFDPMNAHSQANYPTLTNVMQFNADERECQEKRLRKLMLEAIGALKRSRRMRGINQGR